MSNAEHPHSERYRLSLGVDKPPLAIDETYDPQWPFIRRLLPISLDGDILDLGCGNGRYAKHLAAMGYRSVVAVDTFQTIAGGGFAYRQGSLQHIPSESNAFDFVLCASAIYYADPSQAAREITRVLRPGGRAFVSGHPKYSLYTAYRQWLLQRGAQKVAHLDGVIFHDVDDYIAAFQQAGCEVDLIDGFYLSPLSRTWGLSAARSLSRWTGRPVGSAKGPARWPSLGRVRARHAYHFVLCVRRVECA